MAHCGCLGNQSVPDNLRDLRGATVRGTDGAKLGDVDDVIFDHETMEIRYLIVESGGWLKGGAFLLPADRVSADEAYEDGLTAAATTRQIEHSPQHHKESLRTGDGWTKYEQEFKNYWDEQPVMHIKGSDRIITSPEESEPSQPRSRGQGTRSSLHRQVRAADLFPERLSEVFSDPAPSGGKVTLRPKSVVRAEDASKGVTLVKPRWWDSFEDYLRLNKSDIQAKCSQCASKAA